jgi:hypothetical protein
MQPTINGRPGLAAEEIRTDDPVDEIEFLGEASKGPPPCAPSKKKIVFAPIFRALPLLWYLAIMSVAVALFAAASKHWENLRRNQQYETPVQVPMDAVTERVVRNNFYRTSQGSTDLGDRAAASMPEAIRRGRKFDSLWDAANYLVFLGERALEYRVLKDSFELKNTPNLLTANCEVDSCKSVDPEAKRNINSKNLINYIEYLNTTLVSDLRIAFYQGRLETVRQLAGLLDQRLRLIDLKMEDMSDSAGTIIDFIYT